MEYSREFLNSNCDISFIKNIVHIIMESKIIERLVLNKIELNLNESNTKKVCNIKYDITSNYNIIHYCINKKLYDYYDYDLSWKFALEILVKNLKNIFIDSNIYIKDNQINESIQRIIIIDWSI